MSSLSPLGSAGRTPIPFDQRLRTMRVVHVYLLAAGVTFVILSEKLFAKPRPPITPFVYHAMAIVTGLDALMTLWMRQRRIVSSEERLRSLPDDASAQARWSAGYLVCLAASLSVVLYGLVVRTMGATLYQAAPFYAAGLLLLLFFTPRRPSPET